MIKSLVKFTIGSTMTNEEIIQNPEQIAEEEEIYTANKLDCYVVNPSQIRNIGGIDERRY